MKKKPVTRKSGSGLSFKPLSPGAVSRGIREAEQAVRAGNYEEASRALIALQRQYPGQRSVLELLLTISADMADPHGGITAIEGLHRIQPPSEITMSALWYAYFTAGYRALGLRTYRQFAGQFPQEDGNEPEAIARLTGMEDSIRDDMAAHGEEGDLSAVLELAARLDEAQLRMDQGQHLAAQVIYEAVLELHPGFAPALVALANSFEAVGRREDSMAASRKALLSAPEHVHALSNLARLSVLTGQLDEAQIFADRLRSVNTHSFNNTAKALEGLTFVGDDEGVLAVFERSMAGTASPELAELGGEDGAAGDDARTQSLSADVRALIYHLAAVASCRLGREDTARGLWASALELAPEMDEARLNLDDLDLPVSRRNGPYACVLEHWLSDSLVRDMDALTRSLQNSGAGEVGIAAGKAAFRTAIQLHPELNTLVPMLLDRGDPTGRDFALSVATGARTAEMDRAVVDFIEGRRGPDRDRLRAAKAAVRSGLLPVGVHRLWADGGYRDVLLDAGNSDAVGLVENDPRHGIRR